MTRAVVVGRRRKGRNNEQTVTEVRDLLRRAGWKAESHVVTHKGALDRVASRAVKAGCDVVVAVGGDGSVVRVASALSGTKVALGIIPTGTGNLLAGNLKIPHGTADATRTVVTGRQKRIDLGRVKVEGRDHDFAVACGIGFDAEVIAATGPDQKLHWG